MSLKTGSRWSNWAWDKPVKAFIWRSSRICRPIGGLPPWFFEDSLPHLLLRNNSIVQINISGSFISQKDVSMHLQISSLFFLQYFLTVFCYHISTQRFCHTSIPRAMQI